MSDAQPITALDLPAGEYAIVEALGHRTLVGRVTEIERFGTKMLQIEPLFGDVLLGPVLLGGGSIYQFTPCSAEVAFAWRPKHEYELPASVVATIPPLALTSNEELPSFLDERVEIKPELDEVDETVHECRHATEAWNSREQFSYCADCGEHLP